MGTMAVILNKRCLFNRIRIPEKLNFWKVVTCSNNSLILCSFHCIYVGTICKCRKDTLDGPAEGKRPASPLFISEFTCSTGNLLSWFWIEEKYFIGLTQRLKTLTVQSEINEFDCARVLLYLFQRCEVFISVVRNNRLIVASLGTDRSVRREFNHLNCFARTVASFGRHF